MSNRQLLKNLNQTDLRLFDHELKKAIPATLLLQFDGITVNPDGVLIHKHRILPESFPSPHFVNSWAGFRVWLKLFLKKIS